jgi:hypothetical protein
VADTAILCNRCSRSMNEIDDVLTLEDYMSRVPVRRVLRCEVHPVCKRHFHREFGYFDLEDLKTKLLSSPQCIKHQETPYRVFMHLKRSTGELYYVCPMDGVPKQSVFASTPQAYAFGSKQSAHPCCAIVVPTTAVHVDTGCQDEFQRPYINQPLGIRSHCPAQV